MGRKLRLQAVRIREVQEAGQELHGRRGGGRGHREGGQAPVRTINGTKMPYLSANPPKLLVLCQLFYPELVSTGQTLTELCEELASMGVDVEVGCGRPPPPPTSW